MFDSCPSSSYSLRERILKLTIALYRVTDYFPKAEILRNDLRTKANEIFMQTTEYDSDTEPEHRYDMRALTRKIETMKGYLRIASTLDYIRPINFAILEKEYEQLERFFENESRRLNAQPAHQDIRNLISDSSAQSVMKESEAIKGSENMQAGTHKESAEVYRGKENGINERQKIIVERLKQSGPGKISDFYGLLTGVSSKTIQRDLQNLIEQEVVIKEGEKRWTTYFLAKN